ncbi:hypothetical protein OC846_000092 [Tilletia horrida]|uniref:Choline kinase N-terminal domain-containing protein n=1 Tax=Tilletia horrida TaxID=155126 RepID=A0AAN6GVX8_9BASI|nr:hypothetical protein OC846_000092 [Tilletia horrida]
MQVDATSREAALITDATTTFALVGLVLLPPELSKRETKRRSMDRTLQSQPRSIGAQRGAESSSRSSSQGYTFGLGSSSAPSPALSASASSYDGSAYESDFDSDLNALSLDDLDPTSHGYAGSPIQPPRLSRNSSKSATGSNGASTRASSGPTARSLGADQDEEAQGDAELAAFDGEDEDEADMHAEGVPAAWGFKLDASGAMSNAVFFVSYRPSQASPAAAQAQQSSEPAPSPPPTVLLRVYGSGTEVLLSRRAELLILHTLSSLYSIGPHILGTFANGRVEEYFDCVPIGKDGLRALGDRGEGSDPMAALNGKEGTAQWVARRMRELHEVPLDVMKTVLERGDLHTPGTKGFGRGIENHIMASSHRPRRHRGGGTHRSSVTAAAPDRTPPGALKAASLKAPDTSLAAIAAEGAREQLPQGAGESAADYLNIPSRPPLVQPSGSDDSYGYVQGRNNSVASFDSLATSYNSHTSSWSGSEAATSTLLTGGTTSPWPFTATPEPAASSYAASQTSYASSIDGTGQAPGSFMGFTSPKSPFMVAHKSVPATPLTLGRSVSGFDALQQHQRSPYPGVWRRMKRWSREAGKVIGLVDAFCSTPAGRAAAERALGHPLHELGARAPTWHSRDLGTTRGNLGNALRAIAAIDLASFVLQLDAYKDYVRQVERREGQSKRVFAHNDSQYGNLLIMKNPPGAQGKVDADGSKGAGTKPVGGRSGSVDAVDGVGRDGARGMPRERAGSIIGGAFSPRLLPIDGASRSSSRSRREPPHHALVVIDFEYAAPNPRGFDIANHFQEWRTDYHHPTLCWSLTHHGPYPSESERRRWLRAYVEQGRFLRLRVGSSKLPTPEAQAGARSPYRAAAAPPQVVQTPDIEELEALPPPAVPVTAGAVLEGCASAPVKSPEPLARDDEQRLSLEQGLELQPERARTPAPKGPQTMRSGSISSAEGKGASPSTPSAFNAATPLTSRPVESGSSGTGTARAQSDLTPSRNLGRTIKVANSPALKALYSPRLSPFMGASSITPLTSTGIQAVTPQGDSVSASQAAANEASAALAKLEMSIEKEVDRLEREVWLWGPACHALWGLWGIVFAKEEIEELLESALDPSGARKREVQQQAEGEGVDVDTFDYLRYALGRIELFREDSSMMQIPHFPA